MSSSLRSLKIGLSKSYHSLNTLGLGKDNEGDDCPSRDWPELEADNFRTSNNGSRPFRAFKGVLSKASSRPRKYVSKGMRVSVVLANGNECFFPQDDPCATEHVFLSRFKSQSYHKMPSSVSASPEQAALLGTLSHEGLDDFELRNVQLSMCNTRTLSDDGSTGATETVDTPHGPITIAVSGNRKKPVILTFHDLGLNNVTNFQAFMQFPDTKNLVNLFCVVHVNAPGQELGASTLPEGYVYPSMEELTDILTCVKSHLKIRSFIGLGAGLGANVLARYATRYPQDVDCLMLINCSSTQAGWIEWGYQKFNIRHLKAGTMTAGSVDYLMWHHFGKVEACNQDLITVYRQHFEKSINPTNLGLLIESYIRRTDLGIVREMDPIKKKTVQMIRCPVLNVTASFSPHIEDTVAFNGRLDPTMSTWMKIQDCGLVLDEQPGKIIEALRLFLQGQGYAVVGSRRSSAVSVGEAATNRSLGSRQISCSSLSKSTESQGSTDMRITENPLQNPTV